MTFPKQLMIKNQWIPRFGDHDSRKVRVRILKSRKMKMKNGVLSSLVNLPTAPPITLQK
jgi:hypothetical protein